MRPEQETTAKELLHQVSVARLSEHFSQLRLPLAQVYLDSWRKEGLCPSLAVAQEKIDSFDSTQAFVLLDQHQQPLAAVHTLLTDAPDITEVLRRFDTYATVEAASRLHLSVAHPTFRICFSLITRFGYRIQTSDMATDLSPVHFLLNQLPRRPQILPYSRWPAVGMHCHFGAQIVAVLNNSRPEDTASRGQNVLLLYP